MGGRTNPTWPRPNKITWYVILINHRAYKK